MTGVVLVCVVGVLVAVTVVGFVARRVGTGAGGEVLATVADDLDLPRLEVNGFTFHAEAHGDVTRPVIIVIHGGPGGDYRSLLTLTDLADRYRVVFFDQRGAGLSTRVPAAELTAETALADLDAIIDHHSPGAPVHLIGHSWGATLAAGYLRHRPDRVGAAVLAEPGYLDQSEYDEWRQRYEQLMSGWSYARLAVVAGFAAQRISEPDEHASDDYLVGQRILPAFLNHPDNPYHRPGHRYSAPSWRWGKVAGDALSGEIFSDATGSRPPFTGPVLFLAGACNTWIGEALQARHAESYPNASVVVISDAGHDMFWDNPPDTLAAIRRFLGVECAMDASGGDTLEHEPPDNSATPWVRLDQ
ncbi:MAG: alpha/beta hydrolase [Microthrixaceae bacterium]|nr:alpha/beta hydrolase [Microthrixaceae bacterium]